jgi:cysteinyl-tRNA synthetase
MLHLFDTATRRVAEVVPGADGRVGLYVCGPTVSGPPHVGHGRLSLVFDVLRRYLEHRGSAVLHVSNVTDVDDKIIRRAQTEGRECKDVADEAEEQWWAAMDALGALRPHAIPHATEYIAQMAELVADLVQRGAAYPAEDGVYLSVAAIPGYGLLPHQDPDELRAGARVEADESKRAPADFALWKAARPGEPSWNSPFGPGRPGWHTECVVMSLALLGEGFSLHGGGQDLIFPHHENERAQAVALGRDFARHWVHEGMVVAGGQKMSKSVGNVLDLRGLLSHADPRAYRMLVLRSHYRSPLEVLPEILDDAARAVERVDALGRRLAQLAAASPGAGGASAPGGAGRSGAPGGAGGANAGGTGERGRAGTDRAADDLSSVFYAAMDDDLDTPAALAGIFEGIRRANALIDAGDTAAAHSLGQRAIELLGALGLSPAGEESAPAELIELAQRRESARRGGDFAAADELRAEIERLGWQVEDTPSGPKLRRRPQVD